MRIDESQLENFISDSGLVSKRDMEEARVAATEKGTGLGKALLARGVITDDDLRRVEAYILGIPFVNLKNQKLDFSVLSLIPEPVARNHNIVAFHKSEDALEIAVLDMGSLPTVEMFRKEWGFKLKPHLTDVESIKFALLFYQEALKNEFGEIIQEQAKDLEILGIDSNTNLEKLAEQSQIARVLETIVKHALLQKASTVSIEPDENQILVRYRINGFMHDAMVLPKSLLAGIVARIKLISNLKISETNLPQDGWFKIENKGESISVRVSVMPVLNGEKVSMRLARANLSAGWALEGLGLRDEILESVYKVLGRASGLVVVGGSANSGKTTTLYTMLDILNAPDVDIATIEDPIENDLSRINQTQVRPDISLTYAAGLRAIVRQDPDVIMIGDLKDRETAAIAVSAALSGKLVLTSIRSKSTAETIKYLVEDMNIEPSALASSLNAVIFQNLSNEGPASDSRKLAAEILVATSRVREMLKSNISPEAFEDEILK